MKKSKYVLVLYLMLSGCAVTSLYDKNEIVLNDSSGNVINGEWKNDSGVSIFMDCGSSMYSIMVFPVIPLPPIIPTMGAGEDQMGIRIYSEKPKKLIVNNVRLSGLANKSFLRKVNTFDYQSNYSIDSSCKDLSGSEISISISEPEKINVSFKVIETTSTLKMGFSYLGE